MELTNNMAAEDGEKAESSTVSIDRRSFIKSGSALASVGLLGTLPQSAKALDTSSIDITPRASLTYYTGAEGNGGASTFTISTLNYYGSATGDYTTHSYHEFDLHTISFPIGEPMDVDRDWDYPYLPTSQSYNSKKALNISTAGGTATFKEDFPHGVYEPEKLLEQIKELTDEASDYQTGQQWEEMHKNPAQFVENAGLDLEEFDFEKGREEVTEIIEKEVESPNAAASTGFSAGLTLGGIIAPEKVSTAYGISSLVATGVAHVGNAFTEHEEIQFEKTIPTESDSDGAIEVPGSGYLEIEDDGNPYTGSYQTQAKGYQCSFTVESRNDSTDPDLNFSKEYYPRNNYDANAFVYLSFDLPPEPGSKTSAELSDEIASNMRDAYTQAQNPENPDTYLGDADSGEPPTENLIYREPRYT